MSVKPYTLTLRLAGESLTAESRAQLYANAEKFDISHSQILFIEDATIEVRRLNETEIIRDWLTSTEAHAVIVRACEESTRSDRPERSAGKHTQ